MSNVLKSMKLDIYVLKSYCKTFLMVYVIGTVVSTLVRVPAVVGAFVLVIAAPFTGMYFSTYEKNNLSKLYGILPLGKSDTVVGRYLFALLWGGANGIVAAALALVLSRVVNGRVDSLTMNAVLLVASLYFCLMISILFPLYFRFPFSKVYIYSNVPFYLTIPGTIYLVRKTDFLKNISQAVQYFSAHTGAVWAGAIGVGLILLAVSCAVSVQLYKQVEL